MPPKPIHRRAVILGAGGHGKVVLELVRSAWPQVELVGFLDPDTTARTVLGLPVIGDDGRLEALRAEGVSQAFVALGQNGLREILAGRAEAIGFELPAAISPHACVSPSARIGRGVVVLQGAIINAEAEVGDFAIINSGAIVEHDSRVGAAAHIAPGAVLGGEAQVGARALVGLGSRVLPRITIGPDVRLGAGACATSDLRAGVTAVGVPARIIAEPDA